MAETTPRKSERQVPAPPPDYQADLRIPATPEALAKAVLRGGAPRREPPPAVTD